MTNFSHSYRFDPTYGYAFEQLLGVLPPEGPPDFRDFWMARFARAMAIAPEPRLTILDEYHPRFVIHELAYRSSGGFTIRGWALVPRSGQVRRGIVVGHGYGGREGPDFHLPPDDCVFFFPCFRGLGLSRCPSISENPAYHVLHDIHDRDLYVIGACVDDLWLAVSALLELFPECLGHVGFMGISFGGGLGALALPWDDRIRLAHLNVPTFGHVPLRLALPTLGSGEAIRIFERRHGGVLNTLQYFDAGTAARYCRVPVHLALALFDPVVAPPGQFAIYNALSCPKELFVLDAGHFSYPRQAEQEQQLLGDLANFFNCL